MGVSIYGFRHGFGRLRLMIQGLGFEGFGV